MNFKFITQYETERDIDHSFNYDPKFLAGLLNITINPMFHDGEFFSQKSGRFSQSLSHSYVFLVERERAPSF